MSKKKDPEAKWRTRTWVVDFDDFCDNVIDELDVLQQVKEKYHDFQCTLFTIPSRTSPATIKAAKALGDWVKLAPHGYFHTRGECLAWTDTEAYEKIKLARDIGICEPVFRAPGWLLDANVYDACERLDYVVASHKGYRIPADGRTSRPGEYVYNDVTRRRKGTRAIHGHLTPVSGNYIKDMVEKGTLAFGEKRRFLSCVEAAV